MEDDAVVRFEYLDLLDKRLRALSGNFTAVYAGSYNPKGTDMLPEGFYPKDYTHIPAYRGVQQHCINCAFLHLTCALAFILSVCLVCTRAWANDAGGWCRAQRGRDGAHNEWPADSRAD